MCKWFEEIISDLGTINRHVLLGSKIDEFDLASRDIIESRLDDAIESCLDFEANLNLVYEIFPHVKEYTGHEISKALRVIACLKDNLDLFIHFSDYNLKSRTWVKNESEVKKLSSAISYHQNLIKENSNINFKANLDYESLRNKIINGRKKKFHQVRNRLPYLKDQDYVDAKDKLRQVFKNGKLPWTDQELLRVIENCIQEKEIRKKINKYNSLVGDIFKTSLSEKDLFSIDTSLLDKMLLFANHIYPSAKKLNQAELFFTSDKREDLENLTLTKIQNSLNERNISLNNVFELFKFDDKAKARLLISKLEDQRKKFQGLKSSFEDIPTWVSLQKTIELMKIVGFGKIIPHILEWDKNDNNLALSIEYTYLSLYISKFLADKKLTKFTAEFLNDKRCELAKLDQEMLNANAIELATKHWDSIPRINLGGKFNEFCKLLNKKRVPSLREIMSEYGHIIIKIFRAIMTNTATCSQIFPPSLDLGAVSLNFDEISQLRFINSVSPILRADKLCGFGDNKQMPPDNDFSSNKPFELEKGDIPLDFLPNTSLLEKGLNANLPEYALDMHFRSKKPDLIEMSSRLFYNLKFFPNPDTSYGLSYDYVDNAKYVSKDSDSSKINREEAKAVAKKLIQIIRERPDKTIGIIVMNEEQVEEVLRQIDILRSELNNKKVDAYFSSKAGSKFFVQALEKVQGKERDEIIAGTTYAKNETGKFLLRLGPIIKAGGEKRLNVMTTRAKERMHIVSSIDPKKDLDLSRTDSYGVLVLRLILIYARDHKFSKEEYIYVKDFIRRTGHDVNLEKLFSGLINDSEEGLNDSSKPKLSAYLNSIKSELEAQGLKVDINFTDSRTSPDLAIKDPNDDTYNILGLITDDQSILNAGTARDREITKPKT